MKCLGMFNDGHDLEKTYEIVCSWIDEFGTDIRGFVLGDDNFTLQTVVKAFEDKGARMPLFAAFGNSATGMDAIGKGLLGVESCQSAETDGALPIVVGVDYFNGLKVEEIKYLPKGIINKANVVEYLPAQW